MGRHPVLTVLMVIAGAILLLPGLCAVFFIAVSGFSIGSGDSWIVTLWIICLLIAAAGVWLIVRALR